MQQTTDVLDRLTGIEATLLSHTRDIAGCLALPPSDKRRAAVQAQWPRIAALRAAYRQAVQDLRGQLPLMAPETPLRAAARRHLLCHGPTRAAIWDSVTDMVSRQMLPTAFPPLVTERSEIVRGPEFGMINYLTHILFDIANPQSRDPALVADTHYRDIPLSGAYFLNLCQAARRILLAMGKVEPVRFLDIGCGGGTKVIAASTMFETAHGIELSPDYLAHAQRFMASIGQDGGMLRQADALQYDGYGAYDVLYFYRPLKVPALADALETRVLAQARPGTILIAPLNATLGRRNQQVARVTDVIFLAHKTRSEVAEIADRAAQIGCETRIGVRRDPVALGFWEPILSQSERNGFVLR